MKKLISLVVALAVLTSLAGCARPMTICGVTYDSYGLLNNSEGQKNPGIQYEIVWGNVAWAGILVETFFVPVYVFGFSLFQPIGIKPLVTPGAQQALKGAINQTTCARATP